MPDGSDGLEALQALIDRSTRTATASVAESIAFPDRQMTAAELVAFWRDARAGRSGQPRKVVTIEVALTRIYAMRAPERSAPPAGDAPS